jgi:two-component sensor histidine kinase
MIGWAFAGEGLVLTWSERNFSAAIAKPTSTGFGSRLIKSAVEGQLGGKVDIVWKPSGVQLRLELSQARLRD